MTEERTHDVVLLGATGFTGALAAEYLARNAPAGTRWALAGRNRAKLEALRERLELDVPLEHADVSDARSLEALARSARVVISTVGPYLRYGEPLVAACAQAGTDYVDLTGEPEFVDQMYLRHHATAVQSGARLVHCCGFDSIPHDLGVQFAVEQLPEGVPLKVEGIVRAGGRPSGGTFYSALTAFSRVRSYASVAGERRRSEPRPTTRQTHTASALPRRDSELGWILPLPTIDPQIVLRSARALDRYGPDFTYGHYAAVKRLPVAVAAAGGVAGLFTLAQLPPARRLLLSRLTPGDGPSAEQRARSWFNVRFVGSGGGQRVVVEVSGGDPGYDETAKMMCEAALCLAHDELAPSAGQVTTAVAMGEPLRSRLQQAGIEFSVVG
ncbi:MAG TPA: saccharopine dehydrogenase NADP-binding domain-containing protein [Solirubrobacteraceae bacterium]|nr:saccharopine dehydrogenase NADP-binding domain-containing protein [Solirubrobacteraceae bacterium]